jgi:hypothetical protein
LSLLAFELDSHAQFQISKLFLITSFILIQRYLEVVVNDKEANFEAFDEEAFSFLHRQVFVLNFANSTFL